MAISEAFAGTAATSATELSLPRNAAYSAASPQTTAGVYQIFLDVNGMVAGNEIQIRIYEKVRAADTQRPTYQSNLVGLQSPAHWVSPSLILMNGWDVTLVGIAGTPTITWSIRKVA
jgi:hypothetical protein